MKLLVTGGAGFIGSNFLQMYIDAFDKVVCFDALTYAGNYNNIKNLENFTNYKFVKGDITDRELVYDLFEKEDFDCVVNFAAESHVDNSIKNPEIFLKTNVLGTQVLLDACIKYNCKRFHQVSTDEVYGSLPIDKKELKFTESSALKPSSPYSASKAAADLLVLAYYKTYGLNVTISRCSNNYGPNQFPEKLIPVIISKILKNEPIPVYGDGNNIRDWIYVKEHCSAIYTIIKSDAHSGEVFNIGSNCEKTNLEIIKSIVNILEQQEYIVKYVKDRLGHDKRYAIDSQKIRDIFNWQEKCTDFDLLLKETVQWYVKNQEWLKEIENKEYLNAYKKSY